MGLRAALICRLLDGLGGTTTTVLEHARRLAARGWEVDVYAERFGEAFAGLAGVSCRRLWRWPWGSGLKRSLFAWQADRAAARRGYDLVHGHGDNLVQDVLSLHNCVHAAYEAIHGCPLPGGDAVGRLHARVMRESRFKVLVANSRLMRDEVVSRFGLDPARVAVVHPGHDPSRFRARDRELHRGPARAELGLAEGDVALGLITSGDFRKRGVEVFVRALGLLARRKDLSLRALVVGKEARLGPYLRRAGLEGAAGLVTFLPATSRVERLYHALDVYAHPAYYEEFGQGVQEALACGVPVVTTPRVGAAELMPPALRELIVPAGDAEALSRVLEALARDPDRRARLGGLGPQAVSGNSWDANFEATAALYERARACR